MNVQPTAIPEVVLIRPRVFEDPRGYFLESWNQREFEKAGLAANFVQDNLTRSCRRTLRGLHYQIRRTQGKLVHVLAGQIFDVAVDLRVSSTSFGQWSGTRLSGEAHEALWIPPGFAHGFLVLSESADILYKTTDFYSPEDERIIRWNDPELGIEWPLADGLEPLLSAKDQRGGNFREAEHFP